MAGYLLPYQVRHENSLEVGKQVKATEFIQMYDWTSIADHSR